jgi:cathepsin D
LGGFQIKNQNFGEITDEEGDVFYNGYFAGILGLAFPNMSPGETTPVFDSMIS